MSKLENPSTIAGSRIELNLAARPEARLRDVSQSVTTRAEKPGTAPSPSGEQSRETPGRDGGAKTPATSPIKRFGVWGVFAVLAAIGAYQGYRYVTVGRYFIVTDDAYVRADMSVIAAKVSGYVATVQVKDNAHVTAGDPLLTIDDGDYRLAVEAAKGKIATQQATIERIGEQTNAQQAAIDQSRAQISTAKADVTRTAADFDRTNSLARSNYASAKSLDQARADQQKALASVASATAGLTAAQANLAVVNAQKTEAQQTKAELEISLAKVERDLSFATVKAPVSGIIGNRSVQLGDFVQPGTRLLAIVPMDSVYVEANFKETQLARMKPGQTASVTVDALSGRKITGVVESLAPASGSQFSLLPPENATGNFTKIVQRVPVRIKLPVDAISQGGFRNGLSVVVEVDTREEADQHGGVAPTATAAKP